LNVEVIVSDQQLLGLDDPAWVALNVRIPNASREEGLD
jgi:hypothetical protein